MTNTYVVTGAAGFIGWHLANKLATIDGNNVTVIDDFSNGAADSAFKALIARDNVSFVELDLANDDIPEGVIRNNCTVFHLAAINGTANFYNKPYDVFRAAIFPTDKLIKECVRTSSKLVQASTSETYAGAVSKFNWTVPTGEDVPLCIEDPTNVRWSYGGGKIGSEIAIHAARQQIGLDAVIIRYHNVYGPRMGIHHVVPDFINRALDGVLELYGHEDTRSFIYIDDAVTGTICAAENIDKDKDKDKVTINIGSDTELKIRVLGETIAKLMEVDGEIELHDSPAGSVPRRCADVSYLKSLGWSETVSFEDGLKETITWYAENKL